MHGYELVGDKIVALLQQTNFIHVIQKKKKEMRYYRLMISVWQMKPISLSPALPMTGGDRPDHRKDQNCSYWDCNFFSQVTETICSKREGAAGK